MKRFTPALALLTLMAISACTPFGLVTGAGAAVGIGAEREGGLSGTASDISIKAQISDRYFRYNIEAFGKLTVTVNDGRVLLTGIVQQPDQRVEAVRLAWQIDGVKQVINEIRVADSRSFPSYLRDQWVTARLRTALTFDRDIHSIDYTIETVEGTVYLMGVASEQAELDRVIEIARTIPDVNQVVSYVKLFGQDKRAAPVSPDGNPAPIVHTQTSVTKTTATSNAPLVPQPTEMVPDGPEPLHPPPNSYIDATPLPP